MKSGFSTAIIAAGAIAVLAVPTYAAGQPCQGESHCVEVTLEGKDGRPSVHPPVMRLPKKDESNDANSFAFAFEASNNRTGLVIFKCQDERPESLDCRTPAALQGSGEPTWAIKLTGSGKVSGRYQVNDDLGICDKCDSYPSQSVDYEECVQRYCRFPYMVLEMSGNSADNPPLDPDIIIDPR